MPDADGFIIRLFRDRDCRRTYEDAADHGGQGEDRGAVTDGAEMKKTSWNLDRIIWTAAQLPAAGNGHLDKKEEIFHSARMNID